MIRIGTFGQTKDVWIMLEATDRLDRNVTAAIPHIYIYIASPLTNKKVEFGILY